jgi:hypothetical protein
MAMRQAGVLRGYRIEHRESPTELWFCTPLPHQREVVRALRAPVRVRLCRKQFDQLVMRHVLIAIPFREPPICSVSDVCGQLPERLRRLRAIPLHVRPRPQG